MVEKHKALVRRFIEEFWNEGNLAAADELISPLCVVGGREFGPHQFKQFFMIVRTSFPDLRFTIEELFAEGDTVAVRFMERGTHKGPWLGIPPTGNMMSVSGTAIFRIANGQIVQQWSHNDLGTAIRQLGAQIVPGDEEPTVTMFRPTGAKELELVKESGYRRWPPRLAEQPIFYPVTNEEYAKEITTKWNTKDSGVGYVTKFKVKKKFVDQFSIEQVGARHHTEWWIPAERLEELNDNIVGLIEVIGEYRQGT